MTGPLLRTGSLKAFQPLGAVGNPVYLTASQIRASIGRQLGNEVADVLAIPHRNQDGDTIDWYAPQAGPVIPWSAATADERARAKEQLLEVRHRIETLSGGMLAETDGERQVFGRLLEHVTTFPDEGHLYLVDGRPVVTFWGFQLQEAPAGSDPLLNLDILPQQPEGDGRRRWLSWWWLLPILLLLALLLAWLLRGCGDTPSPSEPGLVQEGMTPAEEPTRPVDLVQPDEAPPTEEAPVDEALEPEPPVLLEQSDVTIREGSTRVLGQDRLESDVDLAPDAGVKLEAVEPDEVVQEGDASLQPQDATIDAGAALTEDDLVGARTQPEEVAGVAGEKVMPDDGELAAGGTPGEEGPPPDGTGVDEVRPDGAPEETAEEPVLDPEPADTGVGETTSAQPESDDIEASPPASDAEDTARQPDGSSAPEPGEEQPGVPSLDSNDIDSTRTESGAPPPGPNGQESGRSLGIPPSAVSGGSTEFLNGGWRTSSSLQDPRTALPVDMEYQIRDGAGQLNLRRSDGSVCSGQVKAVMKDGKLVVQNARDIRCPDGTNFGRPRLECTPGKDGRADCSGRYETGESFSLDIRKTPQPIPANQP